jgi:hypothetical protein
VEHARARAQRRSADADAKLAANVELLALNLYEAACIDSGLSVAVPHRAAWFSSPTEPRNPILSRRVTIDGALRSLLSLGYACEIRRGSPWGGSLTLIQATTRLTERLGMPALGEAAPVTLTAYLDPIVLKAPKEERGSGRSKHYVAQRIGFTDTPEIVEMRRRLAIINAVNRPERIRLANLASEEAEQLLQRLGAKRVNGAGPGPSAQGLHAWFAQTQLYRVFSNGDFEQGGRFYGAAWQLLPNKKEQWRDRILIDGESVAELDYGAMAPRLALHKLAGVDAPRDLYELVPAPRDVVKVAINALLNMQGSTERPYKGFSKAEATMNWVGLVRAIHAGLPDLIPYFGTGVGLRLQRLDSNIAEDVMLHFAERDMVCLGIHDSFVVARRHKEELEQAMVEAYRRQVGRNPVVK